MSNTGDRSPAAPRPDAPTWRLNKYLAHCGIASRRDCDELIARGHVTVNGETVTAPGHRVDLEADTVTYQGRTVRPERLVYLLLNKPRDVITTTDDDRGRRTVMDLVRAFPKKLNLPDRPRIYPVGRLDRDTTGLLVLTNDGDLARDLMHPSREVDKVYRVELDRPIRPDHFDTMSRGFTLEDGPVQFDEIALPDPDDHRIVGVSLHIGRNRIVRRSFEHFGYTVRSLDRVLFAGLTKRDLPRGRWRALTEHEVITLKHLTGRAGKRGRRAPKTDARRGRRRGGGRGRR